VKPQAVRALTDSIHGVSLDRYLGGGGGGDGNFRFPPLTSGSAWPSLLPSLVFDPLLSSGLGVGFVEQARHRATTKAANQAT